MAKFSVLALIGLASVATAAAAEPVSLTSPSRGTTYFNQPGADLAAHTRDLKACMLKAEEGIFGAPTLPGLTGIVPDLMAGGQQNVLRRTNIENCMVVRGWRVVRVSGAAEAALSKLNPSALAERLAPLVGSESPEGEIVRQWRNDAASPDSKKGGMPGFSAGLSLSLKATPIDAGFRELLYAPKSPPEGVPFRGSFITASTPLGQLAARSPNSAVVVITLRGRKSSNDTRMGLRREELDRGVAASVRDGPIAILLGLGRGTARPSADIREETYVMIAPPGRWVFGGVGELVLFCMGAPAFEAKPGEVIFAGAFDFDKPGLGPDLNLDSAKAYLSTGAPDVAAALQPAAWVNGETSRCLGAGMYALEFPDFPYRDGYTKAGVPGAR